MPAKQKKHREAPAGTSLSASTDMIIAIELGDETKVKSLLKQSKDIVDGPIDAENKARIPVFKAVSCMQVGCLRLLIEAGADVNLVDGRGSSLLMEACKVDDPVRAGEMVRQLVFARAELNGQDNEGFTPLMRACLRGVAEGALPPSPLAPTPPPSPLAAAIARLRLAHQPAHSSCQLASYIAPTAPTAHAAPPSPFLSLALSRARAPWQPCGCSSRRAPTGA